MEPVKFAFVGVGNVASALTQGIVRESKVLNQKPSIQPVLGFDVHTEKVDRKLVEAIRVAPNCASLLEEDLSSIEANVLRGPVLDGLCPELRRVIPVEEGRTPVDIAAALGTAGTEVMVILLPVGAQKAAEEYARAALAANVAVVNGMPARIAKDSAIAQLAETKGLAILGDDV